MSTDLTPDQAAKLIIDLEIAEQAVGDLQYELDSVRGVLNRGLGMLGVRAGESPLQTFERVTFELSMKPRERHVPPGRCLRACECVTCRGEVACTRPEGHEGACLATCHTWVAHGLPEPRRSG